METAWLLDSPDERRARCDAVYPGYRESSRFHARLAKIGANIPAGHAVGGDAIARGFIDAVTKYLQYPDVVPEDEAASRRSLDESQAFTVLSSLLLLAPEYIRATLPETATALDAARVIQLVREKLVRENRADWSDLIPRTPAEELLLQRVTFPSRGELRRLLDGIEPRDPDFIDAFLDDVASRPHTFEGLGVAWAVALARVVGGTVLLKSSPASDRATVLAPLLLPYMNAVINAVIGPQPVAVELAVDSARRSISSAVASLTYAGAASPGPGDPHSPTDISLS